MTGYSKFYAHDEKSEAKVGDRVRIEETRPLSKTQALAAGRKSSNAAADVDPGRRLV